MGKSSFRILVVEDDAYMQRFMEDFCELNGYDADFEPNGASALKRMEKEGPYDLAIVDFLMPKMHGIEFTLRVKKKMPHLPIIAISGFCDVKGPFLEAGATVFLEKPRDPYMLEKEIARIAERES